MHADFGSGQYQGSNIGIPYSVVSGTQAPVSITFTAYGSESDPGPMPFPGNAPIEGDPNPGNGDRHVLVLDNSNCFLYELFSAVPNGNGSWNAASAAVWDLLSDGNTQRPWTWTSADAAGLPIFPGLVRYDEVAAGQIQHAIRVTLQDSRAAAVLPAYALGGQLHQRECAAHGHADAPESQLQHFRIFSSGAGHPVRHEKVRPDHGRQWQLHVHQRRARQPLGQRRLCTISDRFRPRRLKS